MAKELIVSATGRRKESIARVRMKPGSGEFVVNDRTLDEYFGRETSKMILKQPLDVVEQAGKVDIAVTVCGGGLSGQAGAIRHGISRALTKMNPEYRPPLKKAGFLTRDARAVERKKYGRPGARKRFQLCSTSSISSSRTERGRGASGLLRRRLHPREKHVLHLLASGSSSSACMGFRSGSPKKVRASSGVQATPGVWLRRAGPTRRRRCRLLRALPRLARGHPNIQPWRSHAGAPPAHAEEPGHWLCNDAPSVARERRVRVDAARPSVVVLVIPDNVADHVGELGRRAQQA